MGLFDQIVSAINNPNQQASPNQLHHILSQVQQVSGNSGMDAATSQALLSQVGSYVRSALQQKQASSGRGTVESIVNQLSGNQSAAMPALFSPQQQQDMVGAISTRTGLPAGVVQAVLPGLVAQVLTLLQSGATTQGQSGGNSILNTFLDADRDGEVDIGDAMMMAGQFFSQHR
ncbi:hypothetical protein [Pantanalinema sp. GBBB05]|uniref:hypothetical protein n=1 Tax=Pantanalinema sp. GBBB05 TaxID=2604139 RepID=UPI001D928C93|nr:hypothetical protein [Pantanalinema sp. GBBB05]